MEENKTLEQKIQTDMVEAMKSGDKLTLDTLRLVKSNISTFKSSKEFVNPEGKYKGVLTDEATMAILEKMVKENKKNIDEAKAANREDIVAKNEDEIKVFQRYLPKKMNAEELEPIIRGVISEVGATSMKEMGKVIMGVSAKVGNKAEKSLISEITKRILS